MSLREIRILYLRELRSALRERSIVFFSLLIPTFLYPVLLWLMFTAMGLVMGTNEGFVSRLALLPQGVQPDLARHLDGDEKIELADEPRDADAVLQRIRNGTLDALLERLPAEGDAASVQDAFSARLSFDGAKDRSRIAKRRISGKLDGYRNEWLHERAQALGVPESDWQQLTIETKDLATKRQLGAFIMGLVLPILMIAMIAMGCFYPAVDATAGERERGTWETLITTSASRGAIVTAKYLYVATLGAAAGLLNLTAMMLSMGPMLKGLIGDRSDFVELRLPVLALPAIVLGTVLLALFVAAGMIVFAAFARTFKEGQSLITPFYMAVLLPALLTQAPDLRLTTGLALVPVANVTMVFREALAGRFDLPLMLLSFLIEALTILALLALAWGVLRFEDVVVGSYRGGLVKLVRERLLGRERSLA